MRRVVEWGDGWMPLAYGPGDEAKAAFDKLRGMAEAAGRDPASIGIDTRTTVGIGAEAEWREHDALLEILRRHSHHAGDLFGTRPSAPHRGPRRSVTILPRSNATGTRSPIFCDEHRRFPARSMCFNKVWP